jgi:hypothetical protein
MERRSFLRTTTLGLGVLATVWPVPAQVSRSLILHVPFNFVAVEKTMPAGEYTVDINSDRTVLIRSVQGKAMLFAIAQPTQSIGAQKDARMVFYRFGELYFLSEVWPGETELGFRLRVAPAEHLSTGNWPKTRVEVAAANGAAGKRRN